MSYTSFARLRELEDEAWKDGGNGTGFTLRRIWGEGGTLYDERDNGVLGMEGGMEGLEDAVRLAVRVQRGEAEG